MDQNFQTSFIPKKPIVEERSVAPRSVSFLTIISIVIFFAMVLTTGGLYFYKNILTKKISDMGVSLTRAKGQFEPEQITRMQLLDKRIVASNSILSKHIDISPIFEDLQKITEKTIRYTTFSYSAPDNGGSNIAVKMNGNALSYQDIALQADLFSQDKNIIDPVFSDLSLEKGGGVSFKLNFSVNSDFVDYKHVLESSSNNSPSLNATGAKTN